MGQTLEHARKYLANGWSVFPVKRGTKDIIPVKWGEFRKRYATEKEIVQWFDDDKHNIGIACGALSNLSVLDGDGATGLAEIQALGISSVATIITGGGGRQLLFRYGGERNKQESEDHEGKDARGEGGYIVAPPSLHPNGNLYRWATASIPSSSVLSAFPAHAFAPKPVLVAAGAIALPKNDPSIASLLQGVDEGGRHRALVKLASYLTPRHSYDVVKQMLLEWNQKNTPPYPDTEVLSQLADIMGRFKTGQYTSTFRPPTQEIPNAPTIEPLEISNPSADGDAYLADVLNPSNTGKPELPTGFDSVDEATWGFRRGSIFCVGARPGVGKTSFTINAVANLCKSGKRVLYFSTELSTAEVYNNIFASQAGINAGDLSHKSLNAADRAKLVGFLPTFKTFNFHVVKLFKPDERAVKEAIEINQPDIVVIDHLQHLADGDKQFAVIDRFIKFLKKTAMDLNIAVIVCSQLHRGAAQDGAIPELHHLKGCGTIEEEASVVALMHSTTKDLTRPVLFRIAKNRHGRMGDTTLQLDATLTKFSDMAVKVS